MVIPSVTAQVTGRLSEESALQQLQASLGALVVRDVPSSGLARTQAPPGLPSLLEQRAEREGSSAVDAILSIRALWHEQAAELPHLQYPRKGSDKLGPESTPSALFFHWQLSGSNDQQSSPTGDAAFADLNLGVIACTWCPEVIQKLKRFQASLMAACTTDQKPALTTAMTAPESYDSTASVKAPQSFLQRAAVKLMQKLCDLRLSVTLHQIQLAASAAANEMPHTAVLLSISCIQLTSNAPGSCADQPANPVRESCAQPGSRQLKLSGNARAGTRDTMLTGSGSFDSFGPEWKVQMDLSLPGESILQDSNQPSECQASGFSAMLAAIAPTLKLGRLAWQADGKQLSALQHVLASVLLPTRHPQQHAADQSAAAVEAATALPRANPARGLQLLSLLRSIQMVMDPVTASWDASDGNLKQLEELAGTDPTALISWLHSKGCNNAHLGSCLQI